MNNESGNYDETGLEIAVIGMSGRFPGADDLEQYWELLLKGASAVTYFQDEELIAQGVPEQTVRHPNYVRAKPYIKNIYDFDAALFGYAPWEAQSMDPQTRLFHECVYHALENSGYHPDHYNGKIGMYAGAPLDIKWTGKHLSDSGSDLEILETGIVSSKDFLSQLISYKLNLSGPSYTLYTACSTSLAAIHLACQGLLLGDCNLAVAGGVTLEQPSVSGYLYEEGKIHSQSGVCRPFDSRADGTIFGEGAGAVVLKRLTDAIQDGDYIYAVIKGSASNNDGRRKVGFAAPSLEGQKEVLRSAWEFANIDPSTIDYMEAHGTGTKVGDPIEFEALRQVIGQREDHLPIGSVKGNIGHLHAAAGIAGFIKAVLSLEREVIPPTAGFKEPNPLLKMENSPFYVNREPVPWKRRDKPRRAGISSFGVGGTNVHLILEEAPQVTPQAQEKTPVIMPFSAKSPSSLQTSLREMADYIHQHDELNLADAAYTLQNGRGQFNYRTVCIAGHAGEAAQTLARIAEESAPVHSIETRGSGQLVFMFTGQGSQYPGMGAELYRENALFREELDKLAGKLAPKLGADIRHYLCPPTDETAKSGMDLSELNQTWLAQPALFALEYALAQVWISLGIKPAVMAGHSIGEYVAATLAGVFSLDDALDIVVARGRLMQSASGGTMVAAAVAATEAAMYTSDSVSLAAVNTPKLCVFSGDEAELAEREKEWDRQGVFHRRLNTSHAFHSSKMDGILESFIEVLRSKTLNVPTTPFYSCLTGDLIREDMAVTPEYWAQQLRSTVRFSRIAASCLVDERNFILEVGPGKTLTNLVEAQASRNRVVLSTLGSRSEHVYRSFLESLASLWLQGVSVTWSALDSGARRRRIPLPLYSFDRQTYMPPSQPLQLRSARQLKSGVKSGKQLLYQPVWKPEPLPAAPAERTKMSRDQYSWLILMNKDRLQPYVDHLLKIGDSCITIGLGEGYRRCGDGAYELNPSAPDQFHKLASELEMDGVRIDRILHGWCLEDEIYDPLTGDLQGNAVQQGYTTLINLLSSMADKVLSEEVQVFAAAAGIMDIYGSETANPIRRSLMGPLLVIPYEYPGCRVKLIDFHGLSGKRLIDKLVQETAAPAAGTVIAYRGSTRLVQHFEPIPHFDLMSELEKDVEEQAGDKQVILYVSPSEDTGLRLFLESISNAVILHARGDDLQEIEQAVSDAAAVTGRIDAVIYEPQLGPMSMRTLREMANAAGLQHWNLKGFKHLNMCLTGCGADLGAGWLLSSLASVVGGYGLCELSASANVYDAAAQQHSNPSFSWMPVHRDFIRNGDHPVFGITEDEAAAVYKQLWGLRDQLSRAIISAIHPEDKVRMYGEKSIVKNVSAITFSSAEGLKERPGHLGECALPNTEAEKVLCELAAEQLGVHPIGLDDHFYDLGGHSLLLTRLLSRIKDVFRVDLPLSMMLETPTVNGMLKALEGEWGSREVLEEIAVSYRDYQKLVYEEMK
ncbi:type I polyketide synthase [Paenibacillus sp. J22TS3]|uniref:type I polyketide synthase n=1 Tax=Paenibacillus sp. J22TS3 TaxID=2807192 RepID=UPI001B0448EB|nr:type I polyketide synthase [Paenibacillus sp. J22TS3]GIP23198.1 hypothetical protein J22TS3_34730 [Paenibacillus sp. J22TS3]